MNRAPVRPGRTALPARYEFRGASLDAPLEWMEESVFAISEPGPPPQPSITLVRAALPPDTTLDLFASRRIAELAKIVAQLRVVETRDVPFGAQRGISVRLVWEEVPGTVHQRLLYTQHEDAAFVLSLNCFEEQLARCQPVFEDIAASFRLPARAPATR